MLGSWVVLQLLLGWALLLGQPVCGVEGEIAEDGLEEQESPLDENLVEEALLETLEELAPSGEDSEELERRANRRKQRLEEQGEFYPMMDIYKHLALKYYNEKNPGPLYRHLEDTEVQIKKAIGTIVTFTIYLVNTNCTKEEERPKELFDPYYRHMGYFMSEGVLDMELCKLPPEAEQEILKCTFMVYMGGMTSMSSVIDHYCEPTNIFNEQLMGE